MNVRWVRNEDPDGVPSSWHPVPPYTLAETDAGRARCPGLTTIELPQDELYVNLQQKGEAEVWMTADFDGRTCPQVYTHAAATGGRVCGWIPGHDPQVVRSPVFSETFLRVARAWLG